MISTDYAVKALINRQKRLNQVKFYKDSLNNIFCIFDSCIYFISQLQMNILTQYIIKLKLPTPFDVLNLEKSIL